MYIFYHEKNYNYNFRCLCNSQTLKTSEIRYFVYIKIYEYTFLTFVIFKNFHRIFVDFFQDTFNFKNVVSGVLKIHVEYLIE